MGSRCASGICLSGGGAPPSAAVAAEDDDGEEKGGDPGGAVDLDDDGAWDPWHFEVLQACRLDDLASVAVVPVRGGGRRQPGGTR